MKKETIKNIAIILLSMLVAVACYLCYGAYSFFSLFESNDHYQFSLNQEQTAILSQYFGFPEDAMQDVMGYYVFDGWDGGRVEFNARIDREHIERLIDSPQNPTVSGGNSLVMGPDGDILEFTEEIPYVMTVGQISGSEKPDVVHMEICRLNDSDFYFCRAYEIRDVICFWLDSNSR